MKRRVWRRAAAVLLVMSMQAAPLSYAAEPGDEVPGNNTDITEDITIIEEDPNTVDDIDENNSGITQDINTENTGSATEDGISEGEGLEIEAPNDTDASVSEGVPGDMGTPGWLPQGSDWYYYDASGAKAYGWRAIDGVWYYLDGSDPEKPGVMVANTKREIDGAMYFFSPSGAMRTGWIQEGTDWYYAGGNGAMLTGWQWIGGVWYYLDGSDPENPGVMLDSCKAVLGNATYFFDASGAMRTGWIPQEEGWYYSDNTSSVGWKYVNGAWYYLDSANPTHPGLMVSEQEKNIGGTVYSFGASGAMRTGWVGKQEGWYYYNGSGAMATGWINSGGKWYYLDAADDKYPGLMLDSCKAVLGNATYFFDSSGAMQTGWIWKSEGWYYANGSGAMVTGWANVGGKWYYLDAADPEYPGRMLASCVRQIGDLTYTFNADGSMRAGWVLDENGDWYYYDTYTGQIKYGWQYIGVAWYYLDPNDGGKMLEGGWHEIGGGWYYMYGSGAMATNWLNLGGKWYYLGGDGAMKTGWQFVDNFWYYMYTQNDPHGGEWGVMASNTSIDGYFLQPNGAMMSAEQYNMYLRAQPYSSSTGYLILVDRAACRVGIFFGSTGAWNLRYFWACSPGKPSTPTVGGEFTVQGKGYYFDSGTSRCYWYTQFYRDYLFHSVLYNKYTGGLDDGRLGMQLSHGCVRLDINNAKWIYDNVPSGTKVVIY